MITVVRNYWSYEITGISTYKVSFDIVLKVTKKQSFFLLPIQGYKGDLHIKDSAGINLVFLSDAECKQIGMDMDKLNEAYRNRIKQKLSEESKSLADDYRIVAVLFEREEDEFYEKVTISWTGKIDERNIMEDGRISQCVRLPFHVPTFGSHQGSTSSLYLSVKVDPKYVFIKEPSFKNLSSNGKVEHVKVLNDNRHKIFRFAETPESQLIEISFTIGKPKDVKDWLSLGLLSAIVPPLILLGLTIFTGRVPDFAYAILGSIVAFLVGQKALILQESSLLNNWNKVIVGSTIWVSILILALVIYASIYTPNIHNNL